MGAAQKWETVGGQKVHALLPWKLKLCPSRNMQKSRWTLVVVSQQAFASRLRVND